MSMTTWQRATAQNGGAQPEGLYLEGWRSRDLVAREREEKAMKLIQTLRRQRALHREALRQSRAQVQRMRRADDRGQFATLMVVTVALVAALLGWAAAFTGGIR